MKEPDWASNNAIAGRVQREFSRIHYETGVALDWPDLGAAVGWSPTRTSNIKTGLRPMRVWELVVIARLLGVRVGYLAAGFSEAEDAAPATAAALRAPPPKGRAAAVSAERASGARGSRRRGA